MHDRVRVADDDRRDRDRRRSSRRRRSTSPSSCSMTPSSRMRVVTDRSPTTTSMSLGARPGCEPGRGDRVRCPRAPPRAVGVPDRDLDPSSDAGEHLDHAVGVASRVRPRPAGVRRPRVVALDDDVRVTERAPRRGSASATSSAGRSAVDEHDARDPPHPLPLVRRVASRARDDALARLRRRGSVASSSRPERLARPCARRARRSAARTSSTTPRAIISSVRAAIRRSSSSCGSVEPDDERRLPRRARPEPVAGRDERLADRLRARARGRRGGGRSRGRRPLRRGSSSARRACAAAGRASYIALDPRARRRRRPQAGSRGRRARRGGRGRCRPRRPPPRAVPTSWSIGVVREPGVLADGHRLAEARGSRRGASARRLVGEDRQAAVDLERVGGDDLGAERVRDAPCDGRLAGRRRAEDRDHLVRQFGHVSWGTPAHHPLQA